MADPTYLDPSDITLVWKRASAPVTACEGARAWLISRGLDPERVAALNLARVLPDNRRHHGAWASLPPWARELAAQGNRLIIPLVDACGVTRSFVARAWDPSARLKARTPRGFLAAGLILSHGPQLSPETIVVEGEPDFITWALKAGEGVRVIGVRSGSWSEDALGQDAGRAHASTILVASRVYLRTDCDAAGDKYAEKVRATLWERFLFRLQGDPTQDDNDRLQAGTLSDDPAEGCVIVDAPPRPTRARRQTRHDPGTWVSERARDVLNTETDAIASSGKGERGVKVNERAFHVGLYVAAGLLDETTAREQLIGAARAAKVKPGRARSLVKAAFRAAAKKHSRGEGVTVYPLHQDTPSSPTRRRRSAPTPPPAANTDTDTDTGTVDTDTDTEQLDDGHLLLLPDGRLVIIEETAKALERKGGACTVIKGPPSVGKSTGVQTHGPRVLAEQGGRAVVRVPSQLEVEAKVDALRKAAAPHGVTVAPAVVRTKKTCPLGWDEVTAAAHIHPRGATEACKVCPLYPDEQGLTECPFWLALFEQGKEGPDILVETHAFGQRTKATWDRGVYVDWREVWRSSKKGGLYQPWIIRGSRGARLTVRPLPEGRRLPPLTSGRFDRVWTHASRRDVAAWLSASLLGEGVKLEDLDQLTAAVSAQHFRSRTWIDQTQIAEAAATGAPMRAALEHVAEGWGKGVRVFVQPDPNGSPLPPVETTPEPLPDLASQARVLSWVVRAWDRGETWDALTEHARANIDERPYRWLVVDESPRSVVHTTADANRDEWHRFADAGDIEGAEGILELAKMMLEAEERGKGFTHLEIQARVPAHTLSVLGDYQDGWQTLVKALTERGDDRMKTLLSGGDWRFLDGLKAALSRHWEGAYITKQGVLSVGYVDRLCRELFETTVALDATTTREAAAGIYGDDAEYVEVELKKPEGLKVIWVPYNAGSASHVWGEKAPDRRRAGGVWLAAHLKYGARTNTLHITHKRWLEQGWTGDALKDFRVLGAKAIYHGSGDSRGSNKYQHCSAAVIDAWHVPRAAVLQDAQLATHAQGLVWSQLTEREREQAIDTAREQLVTAAVQQVASRPRPQLATPQNPKLLVFIDSRNPAAFGFPPDEVIAPDQLVWDVFGTLPSHFDAAEDGEARVAMSAMMRRLLGPQIERGGAYLPGCDADSPDPIRADQTPTVTGLERWQTTRAQWQKALYTTSREYVATRLKSWVRHRFKGQWRLLARYLDLELAWVEHDRPGRAWPMLVDPKRTQLDRGEVEAQLAHRGVRRYRIHRGSEAPCEWTWMRAHGSPLASVLGRMRGFDSLDCDVALTDVYAWVGEAAGKSASTIRHWVRDARWQGEDSRTCLIRVWHDAHARSRADEVARLTELLANPDAAPVMDLVHVMAKLTEHGIDADDETLTAADKAKLLWERAVGYCPTPRQLAVTIARLIPDRRDIDQPTLVSPHS